MTETALDRHAVIQQISMLTQTFYDALGNQNTEQIQAAQQNLTATAETIWAKAESGAEITAREKAVLRLLAGATIKELPEEIKDPANYVKIKQDLRLLKASLILI